MLARVSDPGIVQIFDIGHADEGPYYVAELVQGESLAERLRSGPLAVSEARVVAEQLCDALAAAHAQGVVHCDVKPANVLLTADGRVKVGDFGIARLAEGTSQAPSATVAGTPRYMSPEQARGRPMTAATDVYSAGVVLYEMLAGEPPFARGSPVELGLRHLQDDPPPLPGRVPAALREVVARALCKQPAERYRDGAAMAAALRAAGSPARAAAASPRKRRGEQPAGAPHAPASGGASVDGEEKTIDLAAAGAGAAPTVATRVLAASAGAPPPSAPAQRRDIAPRRRRRLLVAAALLALTAAALSVALLAGDSPQTSVPSLRGLPRAGVQARARRTHVTPAFSRRHSAATVGVAIAQEPTAGTRVAQDSTVRVVLSSGPPPVRVPRLVGRSAGSARSLLADAGLRYALTAVAAPRSEAGVVVRQSPRAAASAPRGSTVALSVAEAPRWRALTTFSGVANGRSVAFHILGRRWRVNYEMDYEGSCTLLLVCFGPSAEAVDLRSGSGFGGFELDEGDAHTHTFDEGPGLYRVLVSAGHDAARWSITVEDYY